MWGVVYAGGGKRGSLSYSLLCVQHQQKDLPHRKYYRMMMNSVFLARGGKYRIKLQFGSVEFEVA